VNGNKQWPAVATNLQVTRGDRANWKSLSVPPATSLL